MTTKDTALNHRPTLEIFWQSGVTVFGFLMLIILLA